MAFYRDFEFDYKPEEDDDYTLTVVGQYKIERSVYGEDRDGNRGEFDYETSFSLSILHGVNDITLHVKKLSPDIFKEIEDNIEKIMDDNIGEYDE